MKLAGLLLAALAVSAQDTNIDKYIDALRDGCNNVIDKGPYSARIKKKFPLKVLVEIYIVFFYIANSFQHFQV